MKILIIRFSSIGDIVLTSPVVRCLHQQIGAEVHYLTKPAFAAIVVNNPHIAKVFLLEKDLQQVISELKKEHYDWVIDLHHNLRSLRVKWALHTPSRSFDKLNFQKWLLVRLGINRLPDRHIVDRYMDTVVHLGVLSDGKGLDYFIDPNEKTLGKEKLSKVLSPDQPFIAFVIGATHATKRLPAAKIIAICQQIRQPVVLLGGPAEAEEGALIAAQAGAHVFNFCGQLSLQQSAVAVQLSEKVITHDTGLMHIAAALHQPVISVWGNTIPEFGMYPFYPAGQDQNTTIEVKGLSCRPCSKIGYAKCPKGHFRCMQYIEPEQVSQLV